MATIYSLNHIEVFLGESFCLTVPHLDFESGEIHVVTGSNGAGKSTLLRTLALLTVPQKGTLSFMGENVEMSGRGLLQQRQKITLVEQSPYLLQGTVFTNLAFGLKVRGFQREELRDRVTKGLAEVGLENFSKHRVKELSGGEVQRVALARAIVLNPTVLLLDEPTANIDSSGVSGFEELICRLSDSGMTVIMSTHDSTQAERFNGKKIRINEGQVLEIS